MVNVTMIMAYIRILWDWAISRFQEWLEHDEMRLGCPGELTFFSISRVRPWVYRGFLIGDFMEIL